MSSIKYELAGVKKSLKKILGYAFCKQNILFPIMLIPLIASILYSNKLNIKATRIFSDLLYGKGPTLSDFVKYYLSAEFLRVFTFLSCDILISRIYATAQSFELKNFLSMDWTSFKKFSTGDLSLRHYEKSEAASIFIYKLFPEHFENTSFLFQILRDIYIKDSQLIFYSMLASVLIHFFIFIFLLKRHNFYQQKYLKANVSLSGIVHNEVSNFDIIKTYNLSDVSVERVGNVCNERKNAKINLSLFSAKVDFLYRSIEVLSLLVIFLTVGSKRIDVNLYNIVGFSIKIHKTLRNFLLSLISCNESFYSFYLLESETNVIPDSPGIIDTIESIDFSDYSFLHILSNINFKIVKNEKIAILGKNSSGKSLIIKSILGFVEHNGKILINGVDSTNLNKKHLRNLITVILQNDTFIAGTIMKNLRYGNESTEEEVINKCKEWNVDEILNSMEGGYYKTCSTLGLELSGGQKQRVSLMRGILRPRPLMIFDDCLSNISTSDRNALIEKILEIDDRIIIMVLNTEKYLDSFDKILILKDKGAIFDSPSKLKNEINEFFEKKPARIE